MSVFCQRQVLVDAYLPYYTSLMPSWLWIPHALIIILALRKTAPQRLLQQAAALKPTSTVLFVEPVNYRKCKSRIFQK